MVFIVEKGPGRIGTIVWFVVVFAFALVFLSACSPAVENSESGSAVVEEEFQWSAEADCSVCHAAETSSLTDASCQVSASHGDLSCTTCHVDNNGLQEAHTDVTFSDTDGASKLKETAVDKEVCLGCHESDYSSEATSEVTVLTDVNGTTVNPHALPSTTQHDADFSYSNCHTMHDDKSVEDEAKAYCKSCHHKEVYECNTCHEL